MCIYAHVCVKTGREIGKWRQRWMYGWMDLQDVLLDLLACIACVTETPIKPASGPYYIVFSI